MGKMLWSEDQNRIKKWVLEVLHRQIHLKDGIAKDTLKLSRRGIFVLPDGGLRTKKISRSLPAIEAMAVLMVDNQIAGWAFRGYGYYRRVMAYVRRDHRLKGWGRKLVKKVAGRIRGRFLPILSVKHDDGRWRTVPVDWFKP